jgi:hypothetical protein
VSRMADVLFSIDRQDLVDACGEGARAART